MGWTKISSGVLLARGSRVITYQEAISEAMDQAMDFDPNVFIIGVDVLDKYGIYGTTLNLRNKSRLIQTPIAENGMTGVALGAALAGMRPIYIHMRPDFMLVAMDQITNHVAKWRFMFHGRVKAPLVIRAIIGRGWGSAAQHSQSLYSLFCHFPGLVVVAPSTPADVKGLFMSAVAYDYPVIFFEHRWLYNNFEHVNREMYTIPLGKGRIVKEGRDLTAVAVSLALIDVLKVVAELDYSIEVIDPRTLKPLDEELILQSVKKTGRLLVVDYDWPVCGFSSEISVLVAEKGFSYLKAPVRRLTYPDCYVPSSAELEKAFYPGPEQIRVMIKSFFDKK